MSYYRRCIGCGAAFRGAAYKSYCKDCYRVGKENELAAWQRRAIRAEHELAALQRGEAGLQLAEVRLLLQLCHPDRHDNSPAANRATTLLLSLRARIEAGAA